MKLLEAMLDLGLSRSRSEAERLVKQGAVYIGGCISPCSGPWNAPYKCTCSGWEKPSNPAMQIMQGAIIRVGQGHWRMLKRQGHDGFEQVPGIGHVPPDMERITVNILSAKDAPHFEMEVIRH